MSGRWHGKALQPAELAIILEQRALGHGKELPKRALAREGYQRSTESIRGHLDAIKRREAEEQKTNRLTTGALGLEVDAQENLI